MTHVVGIREIMRYTVRKLKPYRAVCDTCGWQSGEVGPQTAQRLAIEHNGGTYRVPEPPPKPDPHAGMEEMFP